MKYFLLAFTVLIISIFSQQTLAVSVPTKANYQEATITLDEAQYFTKSMFRCYNIEEICEKEPKKDRKTVTVTVTDPDENKFNESIDRIDVLVRSDTDPQGMTITAYETHVNSGVFEGVFEIIDHTSYQNKLLVRDGDTVAAGYIDTTLPPDHSEDSLEVWATAFIGMLGIPIERVPASNLQILDNKGQKIDTVTEGQQIQISSELENHASVNNSFSYIVRIQDDKETTVYLSWLNGTLFKKQHIQPSISWIPQTAGQYFATIFVWKDIQNPTALSPPLTMEIEVKSQS